MSFYISRVVSNFHGTESEIWAGFGLVGSTEKNNLGHCYIFSVRMEVYKAVLQPTVLTSKNYQNREVAEYVENCHSYPSLAVIRVFMSKVLQGFETLAYPWWYKEALDTASLLLFYYLKSCCQFFSRSQKKIVSVVLSSWEIQGFL